MDPVFTGELLIDLEVTNDCQYDTVDILETVEDIEYQIGLDGTVYFSP